MSYCGNTGQCGRCNHPGPLGAATIESERLFAGGREVRIRHNGETYRLRLTRNGKLILNK